MTDKIKIRVFWLALPLLVILLSSLIQIRISAQDETAPVDGIRLRNFSRQIVKFYLKKDSDPRWIWKEPLKVGDSQPYDEKRNQVKIVQNNGEKTTYLTPLSYVYDIEIEGGLLVICQKKKDKSGECSRIDPL